MTSDNDEDIPRYGMVTDQVWPPLALPDDTPAVLARAEREPVTLDELRDGDEISFLAENVHHDVVEHVGVVEDIRTWRGDRTHAVVATSHGRFNLGRGLWYLRVPLR
jgi:hypothetical protein